jgi:hypothetical protein
MVAAAATTGRAKEAADATLRTRQEQLSRRAVAYLWQERVDPGNGRIGKVQGRYLQALAVLALAADGQFNQGLAGVQVVQPAVVRTVIDSLAAPIAGLEPGGKTKTFVGTSREFLALETHAIVALAYEQLAATDLGDPALNRQFQDGAAAAIEYLTDYRKRGRTYDTAGGWPVNTMPYNRDRPDRRVTAVILALLQAHEGGGRKVSSSAMKEAPSFVYAAQRLPPRRTTAIEEAETVYNAWAPKLRRGTPLPEEHRDLINDYLEHRRLAAEAGGFGMDTIGVVSPTATAAGLFVMGLFDYSDDSRRSLAAEAMAELPLSYEGQRFFLTQFFAARGLHRHAQRYRTTAYAAYMSRLLTLLEEKQDADGSLPIGSKGVEELTQMERVYTTAMAVLIVNADRGNLVCDR